MQRANLFVTAVCLLAMTAAPLAAQGFDGVIQFVASGAHYAHPDTSTQISKGSRLRWGNLIDNDSIRITLIPERKQYLEMPGSTRGYTDLILMAKSGHVERTTITDTVAGIPCGIWHFAGTNPDGSADVSDACITKNAGLMLNRQGGHTALYIAAGGWTFREVLTLDSGILKVTENGETTFVVLSAQAMSVPDSTFAPPRKYRKLVLPQMIDTRKP
jgi:hypothetical protein